MRRTVRNRVYLHVVKMCLTELYMSNSLYYKTFWLLYVNDELGLGIGILGQVWYLIVSIPDRCTLTYFVYLRQR